MREWCKEYNTRIVDPELLQKDIEGFMKSYDRKANENDARDKQAMEEDNEGWITVTNKGRNPGFSRKESVGMKIMKKERKKRSRKELLNFYTFQIKESKLKPKVLENASATECSRALVDTITKYEILYENVVCVVTDDEMCDFLKVLLCDDFLHIQCWDHKLNLVQNYCSVELPELNECVAKPKAAFLNT
uniref:Ribosomal RNA-processing protein 7 C-terminal domain-containing protein n=1 Tax=Timema genevievae TaxID=629358 RepID=A0A7R9K6L5_TIMGE|nr:unnamed protein product [Timema genevievae]